MSLPLHIQLFSFFFNDTATTEIYTLSLHDALPISEGTHARVWDAGSGRLLARLPAVDTAAISPDGRFFATIDPAGEAALWSIRARAPLADLGRAGSVVFSSDGALVLAVGDNGGAGVWRTATGSQIAAFPGFGSLGSGRGTPFTEFSPGATFSHDGSLVALANADGNVRIW